MPVKCSGDPSASPALRSAGERYSEEADQVQRDGLPRGRVLSPRGIPGAGPERQDLDMRRKEALPTVSNESTHSVNEKGR